MFREPLVVHQEYFIFCGDNGASFSCMAEGVAAGSVGDQEEAFFCAGMIWIAKRVPQKKPAKKKIQCVWVLPLGPDWLTWNGTRIGCCGCMSIRYSQSVSGVMGHGCSSFGSDAAQRRIASTSCRCRQLQMRYTVLRHGVPYPYPYLRYAYVSADTLRHTDLRRGLVVYFITLTYREFFIVLLIFSFDLWFFFAILLTSLMKLISYSGIPGVGTVFLKLISLAAAS